MFAPRGWLSRRLHQRVYRTLQHTELFDRGYYRARNLRGLAKLQDPLWHFVTTGFKKGFSPSSEFDVEYYAMKNDDVRISGLNPLFHYIEYGKAERRLPLRSCLEAQHAVIPEASPLRYFITPSLGQKRISILVDSATAKNQTLSFVSVLELVSRRATQQSASLRILFRDGALNLLQKQEALHALPPEARRLVEITEVPLTLTYSDVPFFEDEESVATSWSSALALRFVTSAENSFAIGRIDDQLALIANTQDHRNQLIEQNALVPEQSAPELSRRLLGGKPQESGGIIAYADVDRYPIAYAILLDALSAYFLGKSQGSPVKSLALAGNVGPRFAIGEEVVAHLIPLSDKPSEFHAENCVVIISGPEDLLPARLASIGYTVVHATPGGPPRSDLRPEGAGQIVLASLTADSISAALRLALP